MYSLYNRIKPFLKKQSDIHFLMLSQDTILSNFPCYATAQTAERDNLSRCKGQCKGQCKGLGIFQNFKLCLQHHIIEGSVSLRCKGHNIDTLASNYIVYHWYFGIKRQKMWPLHLFLWPLNPFLFTRFVVLAH